MVTEMSRQYNRMQALEDRIPRLLKAVLSGHEDSYRTVNGAEDEIVKNAARFRRLDKKTGGKAVKIIDETAGWMSKQELLRFLSSLDEDDWEMGLELARWCATSEIGFDSGVLSRVMDQARLENTPVEWVAAAVMDEKKFKFDENGDLVDPSKPKEHEKLRLDKGLLS